MRVLFICTGNTCRSPMAEAILRKVAKEENVEVEARSAGVSAMSGSFATAHAIRVLEERGISHAHRAQLVGEELLEWADLVLTMTHNHRSFLIQDFPDHLDKIFLLKEYANPEQQELLHQLDQVYVHMESKRAEVQSRYQLQANQVWSEQAEKAWNQEIKSLVKQERQLLRKLEQSNMDISDPFGGSIHLYRKCADELEESIRHMIRRWRTKGQEGHS